MAALVAAGIGLLPVAAQAQATAQEEAAARARVLRDLPDWAAKVQFGRHGKPAPLAARAIGSYAKGCWPGPRRWRSMARAGR